MRTQDRVRAIRQKLLAVMGEQQYRITSNGIVWVMTDHWQALGRWDNVEALILSIPENEDGKKCLTKWANVT